MLKFLKPLSFIPALLMMYMIFSFSSQDGITSSQLSYKVSYKIVETGGKVLGENLEPWEIDSIATRFHGVIRKIAHMGEYFLLAIAVAFPLYVYGLRGILLMIVAGLFCVAFACGDEYHQSFVEGRGPSKRDVMIDSFGVFWGIILVRIIGWTGRKTIFRPFGRKKQRQEAAYQQASYPGPQYVPYGNPPAGGQSYGSASSGNPRPYGNTSAGNPAPYRNASSGNSVPYRNTSAGNSVPYSNTPAGNPQPYGNAPAGNPQPYNTSGRGQAYNNIPPGGPQQYQNTPYGGSMPPGSAPYNGQTPSGMRPGYQQPSYGSPQYVTPPVYQGQGNPEDSTSDKLSADMSLKKLVHDIKEQKRESKKNKPVKSELTEIDDIEINEIDLDGQDDLYH